MNDQNDVNGSDLSVTQHNDLIQSSYTMTLLEKRLLLLGMSKINPIDMPDQLRHHQLTLEVSATEWKEAFPESKNPSRDLRVASMGLIERYVTVYPNKHSQKTINWFEYVEINDYKSTVQLRFTWTVQELLQGIYQDFTTVRLAEMGAFKSVHSVRLYELLMQFKTTGMRAVTIEDFRLLTGLADKYPQTRKLIERVINPAIAEINALTRLDVRRQDMRKGRKIIGFKFWFNPVDPLSKTGEVYEGGKVEGDAHLQAAIEFE